MDSGITIPENIRTTLTTVPCIVVDASGGGDFFRETLMGVRHVGGIKEWGGYQRAELIADLRDIYHLEAADVAAKLGILTREVNRRYRAFKALQQMRDNEEYGDYAEPALYPIFHEAIAGSEIREWLDWNESTNTFHSKDLPIFYSLITPTNSEEGSRERTPKLRTYVIAHPCRSGITPIA